jgi:hypothetical protein
MQPLHNKNKRIILQIMIRFTYMYIKLDKILIGKIENWLFYELTIIRVLGYFNEKEIILPRLH